MIPISTVIETSAIERRLIEHEGSYRPRWKLLGETDRTITGKVWAQSCGSASEIHPLHYVDLNSRHVQAASDAEIAEFVRIMRVGTKAEQDRAVEAACIKALEAGSRPMRRGVSPPRSS